MDPNRAIAQYTHDQWRAEQGFPGGTVHAILETPDGYLWIGAEKGLVRFDGLHFRLFNRENTTAFPDSPVLGLMADAEGNLWIRLQSQSFLRYHAGTFEAVPPELADAATGLMAMCRGKNGELLFARSNGAFRYSSGKLTQFASTVEWPRNLVISLAEAADGKVWIGTRDAGLYFLSAGKISAAERGAPDKKINALLPTGSQEVWVGTDNGIALWNGTELTQAGVPRALHHIQALVMARDRDSNIWVGTSGGLLRTNAKGVSPLERAGSRSRGAVTALFEDREGDLWVGGPLGIERFRDSVFVTYPIPGDSPSENNGPLYVDAEGRTWFAPSDGGLFWLRGAKSERILNAGLRKDVVYSITGGVDELWVGRQRGGLTRLRYQRGSFTADTYTEAEGLAQNSVCAVHRSRDGTVWAGTLNSGVTRFKHGSFVTYTVANGLASNTVTAIEEGFDGTMWFATPNGLTALSKGHWQIYTGEQGLPPGSVNCLLADSAGVLWVGTSKGLIFLRSGRIEWPPGVPELLHEQILGLAEDKNGSMWIATSNHVLRVRLDKLLQGALAEGDIHEYGMADGLGGTKGVKRQVSVMADSRGRVWFSTDRGISVVDSSRMDQGSFPPIVQMEAISADGSPFDLRRPIQIPHDQRRITLAYTGLSLSVPERVRFRYALDGYDPGWSEPLSAREATYTNLSPGSYRFRVIASNADGIWNGTEATLEFKIEPAFWQTWYFRLNGVLACLLAVLAVYRFRLRQITRQLSVRFEERLAERTRIAQELHDTLLQGFLSASMQLHVVADCLPPESSAKPPLSRVLQLMGQVIEEGRTAVRGLRSSPDSPDLEQAFSRIRQEFAVGENVALRVIVEGQPRRLRPVLRDEVYRIGREALINAFRHSGGKNVEIELRYSAAQFRISVRDDGCGIDPQMLRSGREGHWGLTGMRERADQIGARLHLWSSVAAGTEVELSVPGPIAFQDHPDRLLKRWVGLYKRIIHSPNRGGYTRNHGTRQR